MSELVVGDFVLKLAVTIEIIIAGNIPVVTLCPGTFAAVFRGFCCPFWRYLHLGTGT
jgi:hypothetical protein